MSTATVLAEILKWGSARPKWQQSALQLLYGSPKLSKADLAELLNQCKAEASVEALSAPYRKLAFGGDIAADSAAPTILVNIAGVTNANALSDGQELTFAPTGLTLVFGDNGAGKSGYVRILRQVCRARGDRVQVHPNAFAENSARTGASIHYLVGSAPKTCRWESGGGSPPPELGAVSIFDSKSALIYADGEQPVAYMPFGLDLFQRLAETCDAVREALEHELSVRKGKQDRFPELAPGTVVRKYIDDLSHKDARIRLLAVLGLKKEEVELANTLRSDIATMKAGATAAKAKELELKAKRIKAVADVLRNRVKATDAEVVKALSVARKAARELASLAASATEKAFSHFPLKGLSDKSWQSLWNAAKAFSTTGSVPPQGFPPAEGQLCVLCQQPVTLSAASRLAAFQAFVGNTIQKDAHSSQQEVQRLTDAMQVVAKAEPLTATTIEEINEALPALGDASNSLFELTTARATALHTGASKLPAFPSSVDHTLASIEAVAIRLHVEAATMKASTASELLKQRESELAELEAREILKTLWPRVEVAIAELAIDRRIEEAIAGTNTSAITRKAKEMLASSVTEPLADEFTANMRALALDHIPVEFAPAKGRKGTTVHQVRLKSKSQLSNIEVLSEGEARAIAIAGFLAEVTVQESESTVVFDDPVSSLDLGRREFVASALVRIAKVRPVVVFTHDMPFAWLLTSSADSASVTVAERQLMRTTVAAGVVSNEIDGSGVSAKRRIGPLKNRAAGLQKLEASQPKLYEREARLIYNTLREIWERAVEDVLLNGAVRRFNREVKTQSLNKLHLLTEAHILTLNRGMTKSSALMHGHDQPLPLGRPIPTSAEVVADVLECEAWMVAVQKLLN